MSGCEGDGSLTPSEQDYNEDKYEETFTEQAQENDDTQPLSNEGEQGLPEPEEDNDNYLNPEREAEAQGLPEPEEDNDNYLNPEREAEAQGLSEPEEDNDNYLNPEREAEAQGLPESEEDDAEMAQPVEVGADTMADDPDADLEEELGGVLLAVLHYGNGQTEFLVMSIDSTPAPPEL